jgi:hypothetical protein
MKQAIKKIKKIYQGSRLFGWLQAGLDKELIYPAVVGIARG